MKLYQRLADDISTLIREGTLRLGERIPSVREISRERTLSTATVVHAYELLEGQGFIETRPRSGFYVSGQWKTQMSTLRATGPVARSTRVDVSELVFQVLESVRDRRLVPLGG
jgi:DNA-binding transcriptional regulator YhcF (GntR family)